MRADLLCFTRPFLWERDTEGVQAVRVLCGVNRAGKVRNSMECGVEAAVLGRAGSSSSGNMDWLIVGRMCRCRSEGERQRSWVEVDLVEGEAVLRSHTSPAGVLPCRCPLPLV